MSTLIEEIYREQTVRDAAGNEYPLHASISRAEGKFLTDLIASDDSIVSALEVGCAFGLSALYICEALRTRPSASHTIIDPNQFGEKWHGIGVSNLETAGIEFFTLIEESSEIALPRLLSDGEGRFDFIFIDGWHTFDQVMLELFYATRLLRIGGYIALDDSSFLGVANAVAYYLNYPAFVLAGSVPVPQPARTWKRALAERIPLRAAQRLLPMAPYGRYQAFRFGELVALKKVADDRRPSSWFGGF